MLLTRATGILLSCRLATDVRRYWETQLPLLTAQPANKRDTAPTVFEEHQREIAAAHEWDAEWNRDGLASGLSKEVRPRPLGSPVAMDGPKLTATFLAL